MPNKSLLNWLNLFGISSHPFSPSLGVPSRPNDAVSNAGKAMLRELDLAVSMYPFVVNNKALSAAIERLVLEVQHEHI